VTTTQGVTTLAHQSCSFREILAYISVYYSTTSMMHYHGHHSYQKAAGSQPCVVFLNNAC
ncbi:hypothetical protein PISMIDRAFT_101671, partial [Pisolithus microcarpus 441]